MDLEIALAMTKLGLVFRWVERSPNQHNSHVSYVMCYYPSIDEALRTTVAIVGERERAAALAPKPHLLTDRAGWKRRALRQSGNVRLLAAIPPLLTMGCC